MERQPCAENTRVRTGKRSEARVAESVLHSLEHRPLQNLNSTAEHNGAVAGIPKEESVGTRSKRTNQVLDLRDSSIAEASDLENGILSR